MSRAAPRAASVATCCSPRVFEEGGVGRRDHFESPNPVPIVPCIESDFPKRTAAGSQDPSAHNATPAQCRGTYSRAARSPSSSFCSAESTLAWRAVRQSPRRAADPRFDPHRVRDAHAVADPGADLDGFVEQGERAFATPRAGARSRGSGERSTSAVSMPAVRATRTASSMVAIAASSVGSVTWSAPAEHDECVCEFVRVPGRPRELDPFLPRDVVPPRSHRDRTRGVA